MGKTTTKASKAAKKSWETRKANEVAAKRSTAAKKAWATRRKRYGKDGVRG